MRTTFKPARGSGDGGLTDLLAGRRVPKTDPRIKANALIDELSCILGLVKAGGFEKASLSRAQAALSAAAANIAGMKNGGELDELTSGIENLSADLSLRVRPPAGSGRLSPRSVPGALRRTRFVLPGVNPVEATLHLARAKARVCEILCWELKAKGPAVLLNRLSDWLFLLALSAGTGRHCPQSVPRALRAAGEKKKGRNK